MVNKFLIFIISFFIIIPFFAQKKIEDGFKKFYFENGNVSSEGLIKNGLPEGSWVSYYQNGIVKSIGNRKGSLLDSTWIFYNELGNFKSKINYKNGQKNGLVINYSDSSNIILEENYRKGLKHNISTFYYDIKDKIKWKEINYIDDIKEGKAFEYSLDGRIITLFFYKKDVLIGTENINRYDKLNKKRGAWKTFYENGKIKEESRYKNDLLNGYLKEYDRNGKLINATLYINGIPQNNTRNLAELKVRKNYNRNGKVEKEGVYDKAGNKNGLFKYFNDSGIIAKTEIYLHGKLLTKGLIDEDEKRQGYWEEYYEDGKLKSKGNYIDGLRVDDWEYYFFDGKIKQKGKYLKGERPTGKWVWFYDNGNILREEYYLKGKEDGMMHEYMPDGKIITEGEYVDGLKDGPWFYEMGDHIEEGNYLDGEKNGEWIYHYTSGEINFKGSFRDGESDGKHKYYYSNGKLKREEVYVMGIKKDTWKSYNIEGELILTISYKDGKEIKIDGTKLKDK